MWDKQMYEARVFFVYIHHGVIIVCLFGLGWQKNEKDMIFTLIFFGIAAMAANFFLRHQFGKKYPEVDSGQVISLAVVQIATIVYFFASLQAIMVIGMGAYLYNRPISKAEDNAAALFSISTLLGGIVMTIVSILLCYKIFNFPKSDKKQISTLAITNTIVASVVCIIHIIFSFTLDTDITYGILICAIIIIGTLVYLQRPFSAAVERMYRSKYNESIQSVVVKNITRIAENTSQSYHSIQPSTTSNPTEETKRCPYCGEVILAVAKKCKHCGEWLKEDPKEYIRCSVCGEKVEKGQERCPLCNEPLHPSHIGIDAEETYKPCIICGEQILSVAKKCKHCGEWQNQAMPKTTIKCSICGEDADASLDVCPHCGEKLSGRSL